MRLTTQRALSQHSPRITAWLSDAGLATGPLRTVREAVDGANRVVAASGVADALSPTLFCADDGNVYAIRVEAVLARVDVEHASVAFHEAMEQCSAGDAQRRCVLLSHLRRLATPGDEAQDEAGDPETEPDSQAEPVAA